MGKHELAVVIGKALGTFGYMILEQILGGTKYRSVLGLIWGLFKAAGSAMLRAIVNRKRIAPQEGKEPQ